MAGIMQMLHYFYHEFPLLAEVVTLFNYKYVTIFRHKPFKERYCLYSKFILCLAQKGLGLWPELFNAAEAHQQMDESRLKTVMCVFSTNMVLQVLLLS